MVPDAVRPFTRPTRRDSSLGREIGRIHTTGVLAVCGMQPSLGAGWFRGTGRRDFQALPRCHRPRPRVFVTFLGPWRILGVSGAQLSRACARTWLDLFGTEVF